MKFKEWLLITEDDSDGGSGGGDAGTAGTSWDLLYPTRAGDYPYDVRTPKHHFWLQYRWSRGKQLGRVLHNIDDKEFANRKYATIESRTAPEGDSGFWHHQEDTGDSSVKVTNGINLEYIGMGKDSKSCKPINHWHFTTSVEPMPPAPDTDLEALFHDKLSGKFPTVNPAYMDAPFNKVHEWATGMHGGIPGAEMPGKHTNWNIPGIKSKWATHEAPTQSNYEKAIPPWERTKEKGPDEEFGFTDPAERRMSFRRWLGNKFPDINTLRRQAQQEPRAYT